MSRSSAAQPHLSRRRLLVGFGVTGLGLALGATACSAPAPAEPSGLAGSTGLAESTGLAWSTGPAMIDFSYGDISATIPAVPQRVVVLDGRGDLEFALLTGYPVIATRPGAAAADRLPGDQFEGLLDPATLVLDAAETMPNFEQLVSLNPDLIVIRANGWRRDWYDNARLTRIAPVLPVEVNNPDFRADMAAQLGLVGRGQESDQLLAAYDAKLATARAELASLVGGASVAMLTTQMVGTGSVRQWTNQLGTSVVNELGLVVIGRDPSDEDGETELSLELLDPVAGADLVFHQNTDPTTMADVPTWVQLPAVRAGNAFSYPRSYNNGLVRTASAVVDLVVESARRSTIRS